MKPLETEARRNYPSKPNQTREQEKPNKTQVASHSKQLIIINYRCAPTRDYVRFSPTTLTRHIKLTFVYVRVRLSRATAHRTDHMLHYWIQRNNSESANLHVSCRVETTWSPSFGLVHHVFFFFFAAAAAVQVGLQETFQLHSFVTLRHPAKPV